MSVFNSQLKHILRLQVHSKLASLGLHKKVLASFPNPLHKDSVANCHEKCKYGHKDSSSWARRPEGRLVADRLYTLLVRMYGKSVIDRNLDEFELLDVYNVYKGLFPRDEISPTRIYYFNAKVRSADLIVKPYCSKCRKTFITHCQDQAKLCGSCKIIEKQIAKAKKAEKTAAKASQNEVAEISKSANVG